VSAQNDDDPYARHWRGFRRDVAVFVGTWLGFLPFGALIDAVDRQLDSKRVRGAGPLGRFALPAYALFWLFTGFRIRDKCPRCGRSFFTRRWRRNAFATKCMNCGLPRGATLAQVESGQGLPVEPTFSAWRIAKGVLIGVALLLTFIVFALVVGLGK
jgi:hypothetical protein